MLRALLRSICGRGPTRDRKHRVAMDLAIELIKEFEGFSREAYVCPTGHLTIGWGSRTGPAGEPLELGDTVTQVDAEAMLRYDVRQRLTKVRKWLKRNDTPEAIAMWTSLVYNVGCRPVKKSRSLRHWNKGRWDESRIEFIDFNKGLNEETGKKEPMDGLTRRREAEWDLGEAGGFQ